MSETDEQTTPRVLRLQAILGDLLKGRALRKPALEDRFSASPATIRRDIGDLREFWEIEQIRVDGLYYYALQSGSVEVADQVVTSEAVTS
jgi:predicted DNA-binding transcriptional regulator YafY